MCVNFYCRNVEIRQNMFAKLKKKIQEGEGGTSDGEKSPLPAGPGLASPVNKYPGGVMDKSNNIFL